MAQDARTDRFDMDRFTVPFDPVFGTALHEVAQRSWIISGSDGGN
jgi:hypothetical protein